MYDTIIDDLNQKEEIKLEIASKEKRFANYVIDMTAFYLVSTVIVIAMVALTDIDFEATEESLSASLLERLIWALLIVVYYYTLETFFKGKTLGKLITKTRVVDVDGSQVDSIQLLKRSLYRIVPFDAFSFLGDRAEGWHDRWSHTMVIDEKKSIY